MCKRKVGFIRPGLTFPVHLFETCTQLIRVEVDAKPMGKNNRNEIRRALDRAERGITRSVIRWKYRKEGRPLPPDDALEGHSRQVVDQAHEIIARRGRSVWNEFRNVYARQKGKKGGGDD